MQNGQQRREREPGRARKVIFENDGGDGQRCAEETEEALLKMRMERLVGTGVDTAFITTRSSGFGQFIHRTRIGTVFTSREGGYKHNMTETLIARETDYLQIMSAFCRANGIDVFWSMRMNDTHDGSTRWYGEATFKTNRLKREHPEWLLGSRENKPRHGAWTAVNYAVPDIRELAVAFVEEVLDNYDVDGVHLDFYRHPVFFPSTAAGLPATPEETAMMTGVVREVRRLADRKAEQLHRPLQVSVRVPDSLEYGLAIGLDIEGWLREGLLDLLIMTSYLKLNPWEYSAQLGRKYGVKVYASLDETRVTDPFAEELRQSGRCYLARAMNALRAGVDGIYLFNFTPRELKNFNAENASVFQVVDDMERLNTYDKTYVASVRGIGAIAGGGYPHEAFIRVPVLNPGAPAYLEVGGTYAIDMPIGDDVHWGRGQGVVPAVTLGIRIEGLASPDEARVEFGGRVLTGGVRQGIWTAYALDPDTVAAGNNRFAVTLEQDTGRAVKLLDVKVDIDYRRAEPAGAGTMDAEKEEGGRL
ncbi:glycoside hydrolase family 10 protein [Paenibacillus cymbidii]|uniref:hypothetical protein n=1 Tax=Paenibacillus cymbidii TaxID=1639034 RepID=UPI00107FFD84|nr:hypothetical protein [Paenibacillus cymbidii]